MKKLLTLVSVVAVAGAISTASALDRTGKIGLGAQESFTGSGGFGSASMGSWSVKYGVSHNMTGQFTIGFDFGSDLNRMVSFGGRLLWDLVENENSDFYTGLGIGWNQDEAPVDNRALRIQVPLGFEFSFAGLPEVGFSAEVGVVYDYFKTGPAGDSASTFSSVGGNVGGNLGLGVHYYF